ncbi:hypothetical protein PGTUg99_004066 [Puccinia graminis f. sp. tritici]|uniref:Uncharacterized protein n=1 Tax=Puccinia graminis f. sp. tritici TaxID=56615 RepID=A0A5B0SHD5_PUCGR|nr:hypothetical protein PGTUg99_004066 [Puccinia graminis f. sp. tritici]
MEKLIRDHHDKLDELRSSMTNRLEEERTKFKAEKSDLILQHAEQIKSMDSRHEDQINNLKDKHKEILVASLTKLDLRRTRKFKSNLSALQEKHLAEINEIKLNHQKQIEAITANPETSGGPKSGTPDGDSTITYRSELAKIKSSYEEKIEMLKLQHQTDLNALEEKFLMSSLSADLREEQQANQRKIDLLTDELEKARRLHANRQSASYAAYKTPQLSDLLDNNGRCMIAYPCKT